ncbi:MAG TPA: MBL fold metallo-hydrolase [Kofleriaceae bacterium]|nr:MBL fold metallo-hydrolase [Kofleriaceae bacterium]
MRVRFFGVRGSCPTPGPRTVRYGGNSVCVEVRLADNTCVVLDAGTGMRELGNALAAENYQGTIHVFITHPHWDHVLGLPFFGPLYTKRSRIILHPMTVAAAERARSPLMFDGVHFPVRFEDLPAKLEVVEDLTEHRVASARVTKIELNHPGGAVGYRIDDDGGTSLAYLTDNELEPPRDRVTTPAELAAFARDVDLMIHDAQYLPSDMPAKLGWGHSQVNQVLELARDAGARAVALHHHDPDRDDDALDAIAATSREWASAHARSLDTIVAREGLERDL